MASATKREIELPPNTFADLCIAASNQSADLGLKCTSLAQAMKNLDPILQTTVEPINLTLEDSGNGSQVHPEAIGKHMDKLIVLTIIIVFTLIGNLGVVIAILLRR